MSIEARHTGSSTLTAHDMSEDYQYTPLDDPMSDLRLVEIQRGPPNDSLKCIIRTYNRKQIIELRSLWGYWALSYTWGDSSIKVEISLNGKRFCVTSNLEAALRNLRGRIGDRALYWIDAMCIDQENTDERDQQVQRMKEIYEKTERVIIWLGEYHESSDDNFRVSKESWGIDNLEPGSRDSVSKAIDLMCDIADHYIRPFHDATFRNDQLKRITGSTIETWAQLGRLFHRSWFERLWVIQELEAGRGFGNVSRAIVLCGQSAISWSNLEGAAAWILRPESETPQRIMRILPRMGAHRVKQVSLRSMLSVSPINILTALHNTQEAKCTDARDRLYAILGVTEDNEDVDIDYSIPVQTVYRNWAERRIRRTGFLDVLGACADSSRSGDLPSWVPDLRRPWGQDKSLWVKGVSKGLEIRLQMNNHAESEPPFSFTECGMRLSMASQFLDSISSLSSVGDVVTNFQDPTNLKDSLLSSLMAWELWASERGALLDASDERFQAVILREFPNEWTATIDNKIETGLYRTWRGLPPLVMKHQREKSRLEEGMQETGPGEFERRLFPKIHGCQIFLTRNGNMGAVAGNCHAQIGDELWALDGGCTPFVLRRSHEGHNVISPCYLAGYMSGFNSFTRVKPGGKLFKYKMEHRVTLV
jgi:hypothetical protein